MNLSVDHSPPPSLFLFQARAASAKSCMTTPPPLRPPPAPLGPRALRCPLPSPAPAPKWLPPGPLGPPSPRPPSPKPRSLWPTSSAGPERPRGVPWRRPGRPPARGPRAAAAVCPQGPWPQAGRWYPEIAPPAAEAPAPEPGYVNYTKLYYVLGSSEGTEPEDGEPGTHPAGKALSMGGQPGEPLGPPTTPTLTSCPLRV